MGEAVTDQQREAVAGVNEDWLGYARRLRDEVGGRNKLATMLGLSAPYVGRVLNSEKPMTVEMVDRLNAIRVQIPL